MNTSALDNGRVEGLRILARMIARRYMRERVTQASDQEKRSHAGSSGEESNNQSWHKADNEANHGSNQC